MLLCQNILVVRRSPRKSAGRCWPVIAMSLVLFAGLSPIALAEETAETSGVLAAEVDKKFTLRYRFEAGQVVRYQAINQVEMTTKKQHLTETAEQKSTSDNNFRVVSVDDQGVATLELMIDRVQMSARFNNAKAVTFDSDSKANIPPAYSQVSQTIGKPLARIRVSDIGEMLSSESLLKPEIAAGVAAPVPSRQDAADPAKNFLLKLPKEELAVGDRWTDLLKIRVNVTRTLTQDINVQRRYELKSVDGHLATISMRTIVISPVREPGVLAQLISRTPFGEIVFDMEQSLMVSRSLKINKTEIGVIGDDSSMKAVGSFREKLLPLTPGDNKTAATTP